MTVIHWRRPHEQDRPHQHPSETKVSIYDVGDVTSVHALLVEKIGIEGHQIVHRGGSYSLGPDGRPTALWFDVFVTLEHESFHWEHVVCTPAEGFNLGHETDPEAS